VRQPLSKSRYRSVGSISSVSRAIIRGSIHQRRDAARQPAKVVHQHLGHDPIQTTLDPAQSRNILE
jgi:hypothetical protein